MPRLSLWPNKCRACRGQPTPPPCYQCTFNLQNPPPKYKSLPSHVRDTAHWDRSPSREETAPAFFLDDPGVLEEEQEVEQIVTRRRFYEEEPRGFSTLAATTQSDLSVHMLAQSLRHIALAFVPADATTQREASTPPRRSRHRSSPALPTTSRHDLLGRRSSGPLVPPHLDRPERPPWATSSTSTSQSSRSSSPGPQNLLSALSSRFSAGSDLYELLNTTAGEPLSPRCSPLPCQLLIPE